MSLSLEDRVAALEAQVQQITGQRADDVVWRDGWQSTFGMFANDPGFDEAVRLGAEYRESLRPPTDCVDSGH